MNVTSGKPAVAMKFDHFYILFLDTGDHFKSNTNSD